MEAGKAGEDLVIITNEDEEIVSYKEGDPHKHLTFTKIEKGHKIPKDYLKRLAERNLEKIGDVEYINKVPVNLPKGMGRVVSPVPKVMKIKARKYSQESLNVIYNEQGFSALKKIGEEFGVTDRSSKRLIVEILKVQEERQRDGI